MTFQIGVTGGGGTLEEDAPAKGGGGANALPHRSQKAEYSYCNSVGALTGGVQVYRLRHTKTCPAADRAGDMFLSDRFHPRCRNSYNCFLQE